MVDETEIISTLNKLDNLIKTTGDSDLLKWYSKLSMLEFCGWIETTMDSIVESFSNRMLVNQNYKDQCKQIIQGTNSFDYKKFREMLRKIIGHYNLEKIEIKLGNIDIEILTNELNNIKSERDSLAHTYTNAMKFYTFSPTTILNGNLKIILPILKRIQLEIDVLP